MENAKVFGIRLEPSKVEKLRQLAREQSAVRQVDVAWVDLVREGIDHVIGKNEQGSKGRVLA